MDKDPDCKADGCSFPRLPQAIYCAIYVVLQLLGRNPPSWLGEHRLSVLAQLRETKKWAIEDFSGFQHFLDRSKLPPSTRFVAVDLEGLLSRTPPIVDQATMVDMGSFNKGYFETIFNLNIYNAVLVPTCQILDSF